MKYVLVRGNSKSAPLIASGADWFYGVRHDNKAYDSVHMLDVNWGAYDWGDVCQKIIRYRPTMALIPDFEHPSQLGQILRRIAQLMDLGVPEILVCPKYEGAIAEIPILENQSSKIIIALSVPTKKHGKYSGYLPPLQETKGRLIHLLGGQIKKQVDVARKVQGAGGVLYSLDANSFVQKAGLGQFFKHGRWVQTRRKQYSDIELAIDSAKNMQSFFENSVKKSQFSLLTE